MRDIQRELSDLYEEVHKGLLNSKSPYIDLIYNKTCIICGESGKFCNSHSIPKSKMEDKQTYYNVNYFLSKKQEHSFPREKSSSKKTGIFKNICTSCDANSFRNYENFTFTGNQNQMKELHLKSQLLYDYTRTQHYAFYNAIKSKFPMFDDSILESELMNSRRDCDYSKDKIKQILNNGFYYKKMFDIECKLDIGIFCNIAFTPFADMSNKEINDKYIVDKSSLTDVECITLAYYDTERNVQRIICVIASTVESRINEDIDIHIRANKKGIQEYISYMLLYTNNVYFDNKLKVKKNNLNDIFNSYITGKTFGCYDFESQSKKDMVKQQNLDLHKSALKLCYETKIFK